MKPLLILNQIRSNQTKMLWMPLLVVVLVLAAAVTEPIYGAPSIIGFELVNVTGEAHVTDDDQGPLLIGAKNHIDLTATPQFNIRAETEPSTVGSVEFEIFSGNELIRSRSENVGPYAAGGDSPVGKYLPLLLSPGDYTIRATPYSERNLSGVAGPMQEVSFSTLELQDPALNELLADFCIDDVVSTSMETFPAGSYIVELLAKFGDLHAEISLDGYSLEDGSSFDVFDESDGNFGLTEKRLVTIIQAVASFGLNVKLTNEKEYFTEARRNPNGEQRALVFEDKCSGSLLIAFEDHVDRDFQDFVVRLDRIDRINLP